MRKYFIVDDEDDARLIIKRLMDNHFPEWRYCGDANNAKDAISLIDTTEPDLVFMDVKIDMDNGFDILTKTSHLDYLAIMVTAYEDFSLKAFEYNTSGYLLKPIDPEEFNNAVLKTQRLLTDAVSEPYLGIFQNHIRWHNNEGVYLMKKTDIIRIESEGNYAFIYSKMMERITISKYLKDVENMLGGSPFMRVHNSHIINLLHLTMFRKDDGGYVVLSDGSKVPVSRRKKDVLMELLK